MRDAAVASLRHHGALAAIDKREQLRAALGDARKELAQVDGSAAWWVGGAPDPSRIDVPRLNQLDAKIAQLLAAESEASVAVELALGAAGAELPPIQIATRVVRCIDLARLDAGAGLGEPSDGRIIDQLEGLASAVLAIWAPGLALDDATDELMDPERCDAAAEGDPGALRPDERLGWAPASSGEVVARAARALQTDAIRAARVKLARETSEYEAASASLRRLRKDRSVLSKLTRQNTDEWADHQATLIVQREHYEMTAAWETVRHAIIEALTSLPPLRIAITATAAAGVLRARVSGWDIGVGRRADDPARLYTIRRVVSLRGRALLAAALVEVRDATEAAFPGLLELLTPRGAARATSADAAARGPYRAAPSSEEERAPENAKGSDLVTVVAERARALGLDARRTRLLAHGAMLGTIARRSRRRREERGVVEKATAWADGTDEPLEARTKWHRTLCFAMLDDAIAVVGGARRGIWLLDYREMLVYAQATLHVLVATLAPDQRVFVRGQPEAFAYLQRARAVLGAVWGDPGDRLALARDVASYIDATAPGRSPFAGRSPPRRLERHEVVALLGEALRPQGFTEVVRRSNAAWTAYRDASDAKARAADAITFWDQLNVFTDSPAEAEHAHQTERMRELWSEGHAAYARLHEQLERAFLHYPPLLVLYRLEEAMARASAIYGTRYWVSQKSGGYYVYRVVGNLEALVAVDRLAVASLSTFGWLPSDTELLARHWEGLIQAP